MKERLIQEKVSEGGNASRIGGTVGNGDGDASRGNAVHRTLVRSGGRRCSATGHECSTCNKSSSWT